MGQQSVPTPSRQAESARYPIILDAHPPFSSKKKRKKAGSGTSRTSKAVFYRFLGNISIIFNSFCDIQKEKRTALVGAIRFFDL